MTNEKQNTMPTKTIVLFAGLLIITTLSISITGITSISATAQEQEQQEETPEIQGTWSEENAKEWEELKEQAQEEMDQLTRGEINQPAQEEEFEIAAASSTLWTFAPTCYNTATMYEQCAGYSTGNYAGQFYYETPHTYVDPHYCGTHFETCLDTDVNYKVPSYVNFMGKFYMYDYATATDCTTDYSWCSTLEVVDEYLPSFDKNILDAPPNIPLRHELLVRYTDGTDSVYVGFAGLLDQGIN